LTESHAPYTITVTAAPINDELATLPGWLRALCLAAKDIRARSRRAMIIVKVNEDDTYTVFRAVPDREIDCRQQAEKVL
jgi:hypothetical protein